MLVYNVGKSGISIAHGGMVYNISPGESINLPDEVAFTYLPLIPFLSDKRPKKIREDLPSTKKDLDEVVKDEGEKLIEKKGEKPKPIRGKKEEKK